jgi:hypothetical protein
MASSKKAAPRRARPTLVAKKAAKVIAKAGAKRAGAQGRIAPGRIAKRGRVAKVTPRSPRPPEVVQATGANANAIAAAETAANELRYLQARRIEDLAQGFVSLTSELWIVKDRLAVLEQVLDRHGIPAPSAVDAYTPEGEFKARLDAERRAWAQRMIAALFPRGLPKVE